MNYEYYIEVIRNYEELLENGYSELDAIYILSGLFPWETHLLLAQGYFSLFNN